MDSEGAGGIFQYALHTPPQHARMHRLFLIQELLCIICEHVRNDPTGSITAGRTLASLARTSKVFHHVATSALWSRLDGLTPLLRPLASDLTFAAADTTARPQPALVLQRPLRIAEWEIFRGLARRVEHLCVHDPAWPVDVSIVLSLCHPPTKSPLFPNLKSILWNDERAETFSFIRTLSGPTVTSLAISITNDSRKWHIPELGILASLPYLCPNVTEVTLPTNAFCTTFSSISEALCAWNHLTKIKCGAIEGAALAHLAKQPALRKLSFNMLNNMGLGLDLSLPSGAFSCVRDFEIHTANLSFLDAFLNRLGGSPASLHVLVDTNPPPTSITSLFTTLRRFSNTQLRDLSLRLMTPPSPRVMPVSAWPHLYSFSLNDTAGWRVKSGITQIGLIAMLDCCPNLQKLCIALNTNAFIEVPSDREGIENTAVQTLGLADSLIEARATVAVAAFLSDIFPNLTTIVAWDSVHGMNKVRAQERKWWLSDNDGESEACALSQG
ncbi:hypothetical protein EDB19DRAFT_1831317 [Suillus lakei]|nr:hypothetical protein EDB19DRAFT_1831317 [Suillus lakei]